MAKKQDPAGALVKVISALEPLEPADRQWVLQSAANRWALNVQLQGGAAPVGGAPGSGAPATSGRAQTADVQAALTNRDARAFMRIKRPASDVQRVACLGYFHMKTAGNRAFTIGDIRQLNIDAGGTKINLTRASDNAIRRAKYISALGPREKQLTTLGEDVVDAMPDQQAVADAEAAHRHTRRGGRRPKNKKAA